MLIEFYELMQLTALPLLLNDYGIDVFGGQKPFLDSSQASVFHQRFCDLHAMCSVGSAEDLISYFI